MNYDLPDNLSRQIMNEKAKCCGSKNSLKLDFSDVAAECWEFRFFFKKRFFFAEFRLDGHFQKHDFLTFLVAK